MASLPQTLSTKLDSARFVFLVRFCKSLFEDQKVHHMIRVYSEKKLLTYADESYAASGQVPPKCWEIFGSGQVLNTFFMHFHKLKPRAPDPVAFFVFFENSNKNVKSCSWPYPWRWISTDRSPRRRRGQGTPWTIQVEFGPPASSRSSCHSPSGPLLGDNIWNKNN